MKAEKSLIVIRIIVLILAIVLVCIGIVRKEQDEVRGKGSIICLECTGLG